ncbi:MarC family protein [Neisseria perflava]|uniref:MarC family protein n=1 Tax=Neisseria perflava TaxID=33053 RepID=UPI00209F64DA|nr:MarC family protein [Neisseria perflava]MCP1660925.1 multiple antibiotic resistance protein [Neisseria perflava]MCP1771235.1 multiple antibiotic resistance protein [Neisseria perflava]
MELGVEISKIILALMVLINPFATLPIYLDLTRNHSKRERRKVAGVAALTVFIVIAVFAISGGFLLKLLGISVGSFQVGGGILVFLIAISMMNGDGNPAKPDVGTSEDNAITVPVQKHNATAVAVVPIAIPMMAGPGGISTVIIYASAAKSYRDILAIVAAGLLVGVICYLILRASDQISKWLGDTGLSILNRVMGMLLAAVSVEIIVAGLRSIFPQLAA